MVYIYNKAFNSSRLMDGNFGGTTPVASTTAEVLTDEELWYLIPHESGCYFIQNVQYKTQLVHQQASGPIFLYTDDYADQLWKFTDTSTGYYYIESCHTKSRISLQSSGSSVVPAGGEKENQQWKLVPKGRTSLYLNILMTVNGS